MKLRSFILALAAITFTALLRAQVPTLLNYQGRVAVDAVNFEGSGLFKFALVNEDGTVTYWSNDGTSVGGGEPTDAVPLTVSKGLYSLLLGDTSLVNMSAIPASVFTAAADVRLRIWFDDGVNGSQLLTPDQRLAPAVYVADGAVTAPSIAVGAINGSHVTPGSLDFSHIFVPAAPNAGEVLSFDGTSFVWTNAGGGGGGVFSLSGSNAYYNGGNVGIGTATPTAKLDVRGHLTLEASASPVIYTGTGNAELNRYLSLINSPNAPSASGLKAGGLLVADSYSYASPGKNDAVIKGKLGIGLTAPSSPLEIAAEWQPADTPNISIRGTYPTIRWVAPSSFPDPLGLTDSWLAHVGSSNGFQFWYRYQDQSSFPFYDSGWQYRAQITTDGHFETVGNVTCTKLFLRPDPVATTNITVQCSNAATTNFVPYNTALNRPMNLIVRDATVRVLTITGGADLAEPFAMKETGIEKGSVVVIDAAHPGRLRRSTSAYDRCVAGIVSGAGGVQPGIALQQEGVIEGGQNVALSGRVYVKANTRGGAIAPGDLLTTSDVPGEAMRVTDHTRAQGAVLGKAMTALAEGAGEVLVLVTLQ